jgi:predicted O-methyltransferase YrrM
MGIFSKIKTKLGFQQGGEEMPKDLQADEAFMEVYRTCKPFTMTSPERMYSLHRAVEYLVKNNIQGDFVECGVWKGGSSMVMAKALMQHGQRRKLYLYDTYEGMAEPTSTDRDLDGNPAAELLDQSDKSVSHSVWCYSALDEVKSNLQSTGYDSDSIFFVKGKVEDTIPATIPGPIALLRLDTDWFDSTYHELVHLYPLLVKGGILIIDDYGHWQGARKAVDQYFNENHIVPMMYRIDYTGRILQK